MGQGGDVAPVMVFESSDLRYGKIDRGERAYLEHARIDAGNGQWNRILLRVFVQQPQRVVVLPIEVKQPRFALGIDVIDFETCEYRVLGQPVRRNAS